VSPFAALLLVALAGCARGDKVELRFAPAEGSRVRRTIESGTLVLRTLDEYLEVGNGRPLRLRRVFERSGNPLEGTSVVFTWVPEEGAYGKYYDAREGPESALRELAEDLDLRALLPASAVAVGEHWQVSGETLGDVLGERRAFELVLASVREERGHALATVEVSLPSSGGRGTLVWDLTARRAASLALPGVAWKIEDAASQGQK